MKRLLLTLIVSIAFCGSAFAQAYESYYPEFNTHAFEMQGAFSAGIMIDGEFISCETPGWDALEVAAFVGDEIRARNMYLNDELVLEFGDPYPIIIGAAIYYTTPGEEVTFKMYDHLKGIEYTAYTIVMYDGSDYGDVIHTGEEHWEGYDWFEDGLFLSFTSPETPGIPFEVTGYVDENSKTNYYLISSPIGEVSPTEVENMINDEGTFDLYAFDQYPGDENEWRNFKDGGFEIMEVGKGYLYASQEDVTLMFYGTAYTGDVTVDLTYEADSRFAGWNLVGNPYNETATIDRENFYVMNLDGDEIIPAETTEIEPMQGLFVIAQGEGETVTFNTESSKKSSRIALNLSNGRSVIDRVAVCMGYGDRLPKLQLNPNHTKLYMPVDGTDYAVVYANEMGEMPVNFKAEKNGAYTITLAPTDVDLCYLHLIDNITGNDVDMLKTQSYTFNANITDYASRFKLVFATGNSSNSDNFAFYSDGDLVINNEGAAVLQVVDVLGRIISTQNINGSQRVSFTGNGVYMIQLVQGDNVKTQKIVVE